MVTKAWKTILENIYANRDKKSVYVQNTILPEPKKIYPSSGMLAMDIFHVWQHTLFIGHKRKYQDLVPATMMDNLIFLEPYKRPLRQDRTDPERTIFLVLTKEQKSS